MHDGQLAAIGQCSRRNNELRSQLLRKFDTGLDIINDGKQLNETRCLPRRGPNATLNSIERAGVDFTVAERIVRIHGPSKEIRIKAGRLLGGLRKYLKLLDWPTHF